MITVDDLQLKRTPEELDRFVASTFESVRADDNIKKIARLKKPPFKELIEEVYPLSIFCNIKYQGSDVKCYSVIGNQGYDAKIETDAGEPIENIEFTWPIDGQAAHIHALQLNNKGHTKAEVWDVDDNTQRSQIIELIIRVANDKALKNYDEPEGSSLVFVLNIAPYFGMHQVENKDDIESLVQQLKQIKYKVKSIYLLLLPINELINIK